MGYDQNKGRNLLHINPYNLEEGISHKENFSIVEILKIVFSLGLVLVILQNNLLLQELSLIIFQSLRLGLGYFIFYYYSYFIINNLSTFKFNCYNYIFI